MARTSKGTKLTEEHRLDQVSIGDSLIKVLAKLFGLHARWDDIDGSSREFAKAAAPKVMQYREASRESSRGYLEAFQIVEAPDAPDPYIADDDYTEAQAARELEVAARSAMKIASRKGYDESDGLAAGERAVQGKGRKIAGDGGRRVIEEDVKRGHGPLGYARVVDADPCPFCAMLASRGVSYTGLLEDGAGLYRSDAFKASNPRFEGGGRFKVHDFCDCTLEPVYVRGGKVRLPGNGDQLAREWAQVASGQPDPQAAWRRWRESGTLPENYDGPLEGTRRKPPVRGQGSGTKAQPKPMKASERRGRRSSWTKEDYARHAGALAERLEGVDAEIEALRAVGQSDSDVSVMALLQQRRQLVSHIDRYSAEAARL